MTAVNAADPHLSLDARLSLTREPFPASRKIHVEGSRPDVDGTHQRSRGQLPARTAPARRRVRSPRQKATLRPSRPGTWSVMARGGISVASTMPRSAASASRRVSRSAAMSSGRGAGGRAVRRKSSMVRSSSGSVGTVESIQSVAPSGSERRKA